MVGFVGREAELRWLTDEFRRVVASGEGRCVLVRGRRRVGKSRLVEKFLESERAPRLFFTAARGAGELQTFAREAATSFPVFGDVTPADWDAAFRLLDAALSVPSIVVIDEFPFLVGKDPNIEFVLQRNWDRLLSRRPVLLILVGSDLAMMEALNTYGRPFYGRGIELVVAPLAPAATAELVGAPDAVAGFDAFLLTGGLPLLAAEWPKGTGLWDYLEGALANPMSPLIVSAERTLAAEFPSEAQAQIVLSQIGSGERTFKNIGRAGGGLHATSLTRSLAVLTDKRIVAQEKPLSTRLSSDSRYRITDPYLRFWLQFIGPYLPEIERGRGDRVLARIKQGWLTWRGRAIEPVIREAVLRLSPLGELDDVGAVGGYWTRTNDVEIDLVGADREPIAKRIVFAGTIKWRDDGPLDQADLNRLVNAVAKLPGADDHTPTIAVSSTAVTARGTTITLGPEELLAASKDNPPTPIEPRSTGGFTTSP